MAKVVRPWGLFGFGIAELTSNGAGAFAVVHLPIEDEWYFVISFDAVRSIPKYAAKLAKQIEQLPAAPIEQLPGAKIKQLPGPPKAEWVRAFTRRFQRLLGFGDAAATQQDLKAACERGDAVELTAIAPEAAAFIRARAETAGADLSLVPAVSDGLRSALPALGDCAHELWDPAERQVMGPCSRGLPRVNRDATQPVRRGDHYGPYTRCVKCRTVFCNFCAADVADTAADREELADALEEARSLPRLCDAPVIEWRWHPTRPQPFKVIDQIKIPDADKLAWMQNEIGRDEDLPTFAAKFLDLFGNKLRGVVPQKSACLKLFAAYAGGSARKESDLAPTDRMTFERVWNPDAPDRCLECSTQLDDPGDYCSGKCRTAGVRLTCTRCQGKAERVSLRVPRADGEGDVVEKHFICTACDKPLPSGGDNTHTQYVARSIRNDRRSFAMLEGHFEMARDDAHEPAWKSRRR